MSGRRVRLLRQKGVRRKSIFGSDKRWRYFGNLVRTTLVTYRDSGVQSVQLLARICLVQSSNSSIIERYAAKYCIVGPDPVLSGRIHARSFCPEVGKVGPQGACLRKA